ncbi:probable global transcription activator SNF2L1 [Anopheles coustani]|uniref:probable global transcription activator SNF2L1 n=1 Tax=Anopheles coustani TaxID=139045 RepID=UPI00265A0792|nr:probable global transcription activator SNF2L1 [Anopheles coustani]
MESNTDIQENMLPLENALENVPQPSSIEQAEAERRFVERKEFQDDLYRHRAKQLEFLEKKLSGFAGFMREIKKKKPGFQKKAGVKPLQNIKNVRSNSPDDTVFDETPSYIEGTMRGYQVEGLNWMISLYQNGLNGILADEMGLGKTIQSISMIGYLMNVRELKGPFLVVVPLTTIDNWIKEFARFLPSANVLRAHAIGDLKQEIFKKLKATRRSWNVVVTSYEFLVRHKFYFSRINFHYAIIDEGHRAKNENTLFPRTLRVCHIQGMIMLTGTPIHNNLHELWALLNLLMPLFFNSADNFDSWFKVEDCIDPQHEQTRRLQNLLKPLMLRRIKSEVCPDIPPKVRITLFIPPTEEICVWSKKILERDVQILKSNGFLGQYRISNVFPYLRQSTLHPYLIPGAEPTEHGNEVTEQIVEYSSKMIVLDRLLKRLKERGSKVLIFTQFVMMLDILMDFFDYRGYEYCVIHGSTSIEERQKRMDSFNHPDSDKFIFALSTRAGGLGINLVAADTVIFYDMDFNPQADFQAEDRAHRIGQLKKVHIFRLFVRGTIEESLNAISERKKQLDESVIKRTLTKQLQIAAIEFQQKNLWSVGTIDPSAVENELDAVFREMDTDSGLQEDCAIVVPGIPRENNNIVVSQKRKRDDELITSSKRKRVAVSEI